MARDRSRRAGALERGSRFGYTRFSNPGGAAPPHRPATLHLRPEPSMSIFRREDEPRPQSPAGAPHAHSTPPAERRASSGVATHIAPGGKITGQVDGTCDLVVDGELEGQVRL